MTLDVLAFGPHPDDVELAMGGTLLKLAHLGYKTGIIDLTAGERATRGTVETRAQEAEEAARILNAVVRETLDLGDGRLDVGWSAKLAVADVLRRYRPSLVFTNYPENNHPDHTAAGVLIAEAAYLSGLRKLEIQGTPHRPHRVLYYLVPHKMTPSFVVDVSDFHDNKMRAIRLTARRYSTPHRPNRRRPSALLSFCPESRGSTGTTGLSLMPTSGRPFIFAKR